MPHQPVEGRWEENGNCQRKPENGDRKIIFIVQFNVENMLASFEVDIYDRATSSTEKRMRVAVEIPMEIQLKDFACRRRHSTRGWREGEGEKFICPRLNCRVITHFFE
jgi:hypothetical protein